MNIALHRPMRLDEFLAWEARQELRYEFDGVRAVAMVGGTAAHNLIAVNLTSALNRRLEGKPCRVFGSDMKIRVAESIRYPDALVVCPPIRMDATVIDHPVVVFEILSESTARVDRLEKNEEYRQTPSIRRYVMLEQDQPAATVFAREGEDWVGRLVGEAGVLAMPEIGVELPLAECYAGIAFPERQAPEKPD